MSFTAKYEDRCVECDQTIYKNQEATYLGDGVAHLHCPPRRGVCPTCHMELPATGVCDDCA
jgi:hypothetical protein